MSLFEKKAFTKIARRFVPPVLYDALRSIRPNQEHGFHGRYADFQQASSASGGPGYQSADLINATLEGTRRLQADIRQDPRRTRDPWVMQNLGAVLHALAGRTSSGLRVLDFGGGMGVHYLTLRHLLPIAGRVRWTVCETSGVARIASEHFATDELDFIDDLDRFEGFADLVITSGALQYTDDPLRHFERLSALSDRIVWNRVPFTEADADVLVLQFVNRDGYFVKLPVWLLSEKKWRSHFERVGLSINLQWQENIDSAVWQSRPVVFHGVVAVRRR